MNTTDSSAAHRPVAAHSRAKRAGLAAAALWAAGFVLWPGCATPSLPSSRTPAGHLQKSDVKFAKKGPLKKSDVIAKLGKPDVYFEDLRVACYRLNHLSRHRLVLLLGVIPIGALKDSPGLEVAMFQFDAEGNVLGRDRRTVREEFSWYMTQVAPRPGDQFNSLLREEAVQWVRGSSAGKR